MTEDSLLQVMGGIGQASARFSLIDAIVGLLGGLLLAWAALDGLVAERRVEIGVMKAVGWQSHHVRKTFLTEAFLLSLIEGVVGFLVALAVLASVCGGTFAGWNSARKAANLKPAQSLRQR